MPLAIWDHLATCLTCISMGTVGNYVSGGVGSILNTHANSCLPCISMGTVGNYVSGGVGSILNTPC